MRTMLVHVPRTCTEFVRVAGAIAPEGAPTCVFCTRSRCAVADLGRSQCLVATWFVGRPTDNRACLVVVYC